MLAATIINILLFCIDILDELRSNIFKHCALGKYMSNSLLVLYSLSDECVDEEPDSIIL